MTGAGQVKVTVFKFSTNLASENVRAQKQTRLALYVLSLALVLLAVLTTLDGRAAQRQLEVETERTVQLHAQRQRLELRLIEGGLDLTDASLTELHAKTAVIQSIPLFSWSRLLADLEAVVPWGVSLSSIQPQEPKTKLTLRGEALGEKSLTNFMIKLEKADTFSDISLADQKIQRDGTMAYTVHVRYRSR